MFAALVVFKIMSDKNNIESIFSSLTDKEKKVIEKRLKIKELTPNKLTELGKQFSVTRERIREIEKRALRKPNKGKGPDDEGPDVA